MKLRKCLLIANTFPPVAAAGSFRALRFVVNLPEHGWETFVLTVREEAVVSESIDRTLYDRVPPDVIVTRTGIWRPIDKMVEGLKRIFTASSGNAKAAAAKNGVSDPQYDDHSGNSESKLKKWLLETRRVVCYTPDICTGWIAPAIFAGWRLVRRYRPDVAISTGPPHSAHLVAIFIKFLTGIPVVLDFRDPWARNEWETDDVKLRQWAQRMLERICVRFAARVVLNTDRLREEFAAAYPKRWTHKFVSIPNGIDDQLVICVKEMLSNEPQEHPNGELRLCHPGTVYGDRDLSPLVHAIGELTQSGRKVILEQIGEVGNPPNIESQLQKWNLEREVRLLGRLTHQKTLQRMAAADILVVIQPGTMLQVPAKLFEMLLFRKPILILTGEGALADIIKEYPIGVLADPKDTVAIADAIRHMGESLRSPSQTAAWDRAMVTFDSRQLTAKLVDVFNEAIH